MKKITFMVLVFLNVFASNAQTEKGRFAISGNTNTSLLFGETQLVTDSISGEKHKSTSFDSNIGAAYFVANNFAIGVRGIFQYLRIKAGNFYSDSHEYIAGVIPSLIYFVPLKGKLKPSISAGAGYMWYYTRDVDGEGITLNVTPGVSYFFNRKISFDLGVQYSYSDLEKETMFSKYDYKHQSYGLLAGITVLF